MRCRPATSRRSTRCAATRLDAETERIHRRSVRGGADVLRRRSAHRGDPTGAAARPVCAHRRTSPATGATSCFVLGEDGGRWTLVGDYLASLEASTVLSGTGRAHRRLGLGGRRARAGGNPARAAAGRVRARDGAPRTAHRHDLGRCEQRRARPLSRIEASIASRSDRGRTGAARRVRRCLRAARRRPCPRTAACACRGPPTSRH